MCTIFEQLPKELLHLILSYDGTIKYRNGMYMNQWSKTDPRYQLLRTLKLPACYRYMNQTLSDGRIDYSYLMYIDFLFPDGHLYVDVNPIWNRVEHYIFCKSTGLIIHCFYRK